MLKLAGIEIKLLITERQHHAYEYMSKVDLQDIDMILTVGGDGILFEVVNGLYSRDDVRNAAEPVPVFPIPGNKFINVCLIIIFYFMWGMVILTTFQVEQVMD